MTRFHAALVCGLISAAVTLLLTGGNLALAIFVGVVVGVVAFWFGPVLLGVDDD